MFTNATGSKSSIYQCQNNISWQVTNVYQCNGFKFTGCQLQTNSGGHEPMFTNAIGLKFTGYQWQTNSAWQITHSHWPKTLEHQISQEILFEES
jgi:hypothetical protein